ncbi:fructosamine kinase family protein [Methylococcus sp. EFPC2]|uniref:fructosamine kinase family protein n=1 Tax=Methylococcus sp. EFPC2 TaxID=2812648 RepID=UPI001967FBDC|nr:fructosamine kinase family protein [Methylococcus sp. EFPC2]QSA96021.1 fructosamine kinase family protein [Methylococcus sp. EFPC2]
MLDNATLKTLEQAIRQSGDVTVTLSRASGAGGGCINQAYRLHGEGRDYFVKFNQRSLLPMFEAEEQGLREIAASGTVRAPEPVSCGIAGGRAYLLMEYLPLHTGRGDTDRALGRQLAALHRIEQPYFGWSRDNTIGSTPQPNPQTHDWTDFWSQHRLGFQLRLAADQGYGGRLQTLGEQLLNRLGTLLADHHPHPSLLHGDLWGGNYAADESGQPVIFDPACYYGDREADLAMTELFGGYGADFYAAYREAYPLDAGYPIRKTLYNLYHILNHLNLFGGGYAGQAESMMSRLLAEVR